jgi:hypothetical protein
VCFCSQECLQNALKSFEKETLSKPTSDIHRDFNISKRFFRRQIDHKFAPTVLVDLSMIDDPSSNIMKICGQKIKSISNDQI